MRGTDNLWIDVWNKPKFSSINEIDFKEDHPVCYASCANVMGSHFKEKMKIFDYGCGFAAFANFMSQYIEKFTYYGVETNSKYGKNCIKIAKKSLEDKRIKLGHFGKTIEKKIAVVDVILLVSIFTHLRINETEDILKKLLQTAKPGSIIVFTMILRDKYEEIGSKAYGIKNTCAVVYNTKEQVKNLSEKLKCDIELKDEWLHMNTWLHSIYRIDVK